MSTKSGHSLRWYFLKQAENFIGFCGNQKNVPKQFGTCKDFVGILEL
jgi:hypothetical protein